MPGSPELQRLRDIAGGLFEPELYERIIEDLPDALVVVDSAGLVRIFNGAAEVLFGYHRSEVLGRSVDMLVPDAVRAHHGQYRDGFMRSPRVRPMGEGLLLAGRRKDGREFRCAINLGPIVAPSSTYVMAVIRRVEDAKPAAG